MKNYTILKSTFKLLSCCIHEQNESEEVLANSVRKITLTENADLTNILSVIQLPRRRRQQGVFGSFIKEAF